MQKVKPECDEEAEEDKMCEGIGEEGEDDEDEDEDYDPF